VTRTTVVSCSRTVAVSSSITCSPVARPRVRRQCADRCGWRSERK
jgi:hypothetical protein